MELCASLISANISWNKLQVPQFKTFLEKYRANHIPDESTLRKNYLWPLFDKTLDSMRSLIGDSNIWFIVDETTDLKGRYIANLLVLKTICLHNHILFNAKNSTRRIILQYHDS